MLLACGKCEWVPEKSSASNLQDRTYFDPIVLGMAQWTDRLNRMVHVHRQNTGSHKFSILFYRRDSNPERS